jgi:type VI secretion system secreted protein VgrG
MYVHVPAKRHYAWVRAGRWASPSAHPLDFSRNSTERGKLATVEQRKGFPRLGEEFEVLAPASATYNCIGWSLGNSNSWVWPTLAGQPARLSDFDALYYFYGFRRVNKLSYKRLPDHDKVLLYAIRKPDGSVRLTHAALQMPDGSWSSKLGSLPLIRHLHPGDVSGPSYGSPYIMYIRKRATEHASAPVIPGESSMSH